MTALEHTAVLGNPVKIAHIEKELRQLWEVDDARTNASLMNFAVYSEKKGSLEKNSEIVREITREHACRAILISLDSQVQDASAKAWVTAHCHLAHGQKSVCCEQVSYQLTGRSRGRFINTLFSSLQSDLPLVFWWQGDLSKMFSEGLYRRVNRFVMDSSDWANPADGFERIVRSWDEVQSLVVQDLAWTRTYYYRLAIAALYDDPMAQEALPGTKTIRLQAHPKHRFSALLLVAWFTELAGWSRSQDLISDSDNATSFRFVKENGDLVDVAIELSEDSAPVGKFEVLAGDFRTQVSRAKGEALLHHVIQCPHHTVSSHGQADSDECAELVADQLSRGGKNSLYKRIFPKFMELL